MSTPANVEENDDGRDLLYGPYIGTPYHHDKDDIDHASSSLSKRRALLDWFRAHGGTIAEHIEIGHEPSQGFYLAVKARHDSSPGICVVSCPRLLTLSYLNALTSDFSNGQNLAFPVNFTKNVNPHVVVRFFLMEQYLLGTESFWWSYINLLPSPDQPEYLNTPMWYSEIDTLWIRGTNLEQAVQDRERSWRAEYEDGLRQLLLEQRHFYPGMLQRVEKEHSWNLYKWAATVMSSRSFPASCLTNMSRKSTIAATRNFHPTRNSSVLLPVFDLANHRPDVRVTWEWNPSDCCLMIDESLKEGAQVYNNYGPKSNEELVMGYGFSLENNPTDQYALKMASRAPKGNKAVEQILHDDTVPKVPTDVRTACVAPGLESLPHSVPASDGLEKVSLDRDFLLESQRQESEINFAEADRPAKRRREAEFQDESIGEIYNERPQVATKQARIAAHSDNPSSRETPSSSNVGLEKCLEVDIHYIRLPSHRFGDYPNGISALAAFPKALLDDVSSIVANDRERASHTSGQCGTNSWDSHITRNKVNVICHLMMIIQKQHAGIAKWDNKLPEYPQNQKQFHAARYRASQIYILNGVFDRLRDLLRDLCGLNTVTRDVRVVRLEHIVAESPSGFATDFRNALKIGLGTRKVTKIREAGWVDLVFTLWVCGLWVWNSGIDQVDKKELRQVVFNARIFEWLLFLRTGYGRDLFPVNEHQRHENMGTAEGEDLPLRGLDPPDSSGEDQTFVSAESPMIAESYLGVVHAAAAAYPDSVFGCPGWTVDFLAWGLDVVTQEGFMCPNLEGKEGDDTCDEYMLFMECDSDTGIIA